MKCYVFICFATLSIIGIPAIGTKCGCRVLSNCYHHMLTTLQDQDEAYCIEDASIGTSTVTVYLKALSEYCPEVVNVSVSELVTYDVRHLYEVTITSQKGENSEQEKKPVIVIDAGQDAGTETVGFALFLIEQLVACQENKELIEKVKWVFMPSTNPDGMEYSRYKINNWKKNLKVSDDSISFGVDITRNFNQHWASCPRVDNEFSSVYPGPHTESENETLFIRDVLKNYKQDAKIYLSLRRDGHDIGFPYAYTSSNTPNNLGLLSKVAAEVTAKVNLRSGGLLLFGNGSMYDLEGTPRCGHSVDYAYDIGFPLAFEMRVFLGADNRIMSKFQTLPRGHESSLRNGYLSGVRELYNAVTNEKKYGKYLNKNFKLLAEFY